VSEETATPPPILPVRGRLLGVDYGKVRVGFAVCDADQVMASPLEILTRKNRELDSAAFLRLVKREQAVGLVMGLPLHMDGGMSEQAEEAKKYAEWLVSLSGLPVDYMDERCTTHAAELLMLAAGLTNKQRKERRDKLAAQFILQTYVDVRRNQASRERETEANSLQQQTSD
jgi:putative holliday junction resolvase